MPEAVFTGVILDAKKKTNSITGLEFMWMKVSSLSGDVDAVASLDQIGSVPPVGGIVMGSFYMSGQFVNFPQKRGGLGFFLGRG